MTELEEARAHLREWQEQLSDNRKHIQFIRYGRRDALNDLKWFERQVCAALSWVWDAQERAGVNKGPLEICTLDGGTINVGDTITWPDGHEGKVVGTYSVG